jgi:hypothetical protein
MVRRPVVTRRVPDVPPRPGHRPFSGRTPVRGTTPLCRGPRLRLAGLDAGRVRVGEPCRPGNRRGAGLTCVPQRLGAQSNRWAQQSSRSGRCKEAGPVVPIQLRGNTEMDVFEYLAIAFTLVLSLSAVRLIGGLPDAVKPAVHAVMGQSGWNLTTRFSRKRSTVIGRSRSGLHRPCPARGFRSRPTRLSG